MSDLKELVGEEIYNTHIAPKLGEKKVLIAEKDGDYVPYSRFKEVNDNTKTLGEQIKERDKQLEELKKSAGTSAELTAKIEQLAAENKAAAEKYAKELYDRDFNAAFEKVLTDSGCIDDIALKAHMKMEDIKLEGNELKGAKEQLEKLKQDKKHLFKEVEPLDKPIFKAGSKVLTQPQKVAGNTETPTVKPWNKFRAN